MSITDEKLAELDAFDIGAVDFWSLLSEDIPRLRVRAADARWLLPSREQRTAVRALVDAAPELAAEVRRLRDALGGLRTSVSGYMGGYHDEQELGAFQHGMETACNVVDRILEGPDAIRARGADEEARDGE